jgi:membrane protease YdiL (CAAX protease family)
MIAITGASESPPRGHRDAGFEERRLHRMGSVSGLIQTADARVALLLGVASSLSVAALFPYLLVISPKLRMSTRPIWLIVLTQSVTAGLSMTILAWIGLRAGAPFGLDAPLIRAWVSHRFDSQGLVSLPLAAAIGAGVGVLILALDRYVFLRPAAAGTPASAARAAKWKGLLGTFYGAVVEEVLSRLFLMSILVWILAHLFVGAGTAVFLCACVISALLFAAGHLPAAAQLSPLTGPAVTRVIVLNTLAGIAFGLLLWRYGLEHAMLAHFAVDFVLHVVAA